MEEQDQGGRKVTLKQTYTPIESSSIEEVFGIRYWVLGSYPFSFVQIAEETNVYKIYADFDKHTNTRYPTPDTRCHEPSLNTVFIYVYLI